MGVSVPPKPSGSPKPRDFGHRAGLKQEQRLSLVPRPHRRGQNHPKRGEILNPCDPAAFWMSSAAGLEASPSPKTAPGGPPRVWVLLGANPLRLCPPQNKSPVSPKPFPPPGGRGGGEISSAPALTQGPNPERGGGG